MHKVINFGSALQAYALQKKVEDIGCKAEMIDYKYPNAIHKDKVSFIGNFIYSIYNRLLLNIL